MTISFYDASLDQLLEENQYEFEINGLVGTIGSTSFVGLINNMERGYSNNDSLVYAELGSVEQYYLACGRQIPKLLITLEYEDIQILINNIRQDLEERCPELFI